MYCIFLYEHICKNIMANLTQCLLLFFLFSLLVLVQIDGFVVQSDDTSDFLNDELARGGASADKTETDIVSVLVRGDHRGD
jgi:hypothetical protein